MDIGTQQPQKLKRPWLPKSREGKKALIFSALTVAWGILFPIIPFPRCMIGKCWTVAFGGLSRVLLLFVLLIFGFRYLYKTIFKIKDRAISVMILFVLFCLIAAFWIMFAIGEIFYPH